MIYKYKVPERLRYVYGKKTLYCKVIQEIQMLNGDTAYRVKLLNWNDRTDIFLKSDLKELNLLDRIKVGGKK